MHTYQAMDSSGYDVHGDIIQPRMALQLLERLVATREISLKVSEVTVL